MKAFDNRSQINYPPKRASIACNFCRHRKRKCDGQRPACRLCIEAGAECEYQENERPRDIPAEILLRLSQLEALLQQHKDAITELSAQIAPISTPTGYSDHRHARPSLPLHARGGSSFTSPHHSPVDIASRLQKDSCSYDNPLTIPLGHHTPTTSLFTLDKVKSLIGEYPQDFFLQLESERKFDILAKAAHKYPDDKTQLQPQVTDQLVTHFFARVHPYFPVLECQSFHGVYETCLVTSQTNDASMSLCLIVLALGKISSQPDTGLCIESAMDLNGMEYFLPAYNHLIAAWVPSFSIDPFLPLALFYASVYLRYLGRPLQAWSFIHMASTSMQFMFSCLRDKATSQEDRTTLLRLAWGCYLLECDDLAEFHFPRSGIEVLVDGLPFPSFAEPDQKSNLVFLAMCSNRKLLNRVHNTIYSTKDHDASSPASHSPRASIASLETVCVELVRQLEVWFDSIPESVRPDLHSPTSQDPLDSVLRARYCATKHIIYRPYVIFAAHTQEDQVLPDYVVDNCKGCVDACRKFVYTTSLLKTRNPGTWLRIQALLAAIFTLSTARSTPSLETLVPDFDDLIKEAIQAIESWAGHCESTDAILNIFKTIRQKLRLLISET